MSPGTLIPQCLVAGFLIWEVLGAYMKQTCCHHVTGIRLPSCQHVRDEWELHGVKKCGSQSDFTTDWASRGKRFLAHSQNEEKSYIHHHLPKKYFPQNALWFCNLLLKPTSLGAVCLRVIVVSRRKLRFSAVIKWPKFGGHQTMQLYGKFEGFLL